MASIFIILLSVLASLSSLEARGSYGMSGNVISGGSYYQMPSIPTMFPGIYSTYSPTSTGVGGNATTVSAAATSTTTTPTTTRITTLVTTTSSTMPTTTTIATTTRPATTTPVTSTESTATTTRPSTVTATPPAATTPTATTPTATTPTATTPTGTTPTATTLSTTIPTATTPTATTPTVTPATTTIPSVTSTASARAAIIIQIAACVAGPDFASIPARCSFNGNGQLNPLTCGITCAPMATDTCNEAAGTIIDQCLCRNKANAAALPQGCSYTGGGTPFPTLTCPFFCANGATVPALPG